MAIERTLYCDGPGCEVHIRTASRDRVPIGFLVVTEGSHDGPIPHEFCGWDCAMRFGATLPAAEVIDLDGPWLVERVDLDADLTMTARDSSLAPIEAEAGGRQLPDHDAAGWERLIVPGTLNQPPAGQSAASCRDTAAWKEISGLTCSTGKSLPLGMIAPLASSDRQA